MTTLMMTPEQDQLRSAVRKMLSQLAPIDRVCEIADHGGGHAPQLWRQLTSGMDLAGMAIPQAFGGSGSGLAESAIVLEEFGATLAPVPFFASVILAATTLLEIADRSAARELLPGIADGAVIATLAWTEHGDRWDHLATTANPRSGSHLLNGSKTPVLNGAQADLFLVVAALGKQTAVFAVDADAPGLTRTPLTVVDATRPQARIDLVDTPGRLLVADGAAAALERVVDRARVALAAEQVGGIRHCLDAITDYAKLRYQFGRPIGSFQAVKHRLADMHCLLEQAQSLVGQAVWAADEHPDDLPLAAVTAQAFCGPAYFRVARDHLLLHGGIGFTWEHQAHRYYKRAKAAEVLLGAPRRHRAVLARRLGLT